MNWKKLPRLVYSCVVLAVLSTGIGGSPLAAQIQPCDPGAVVMGTVAQVIRTADNNVQVYGATWIAGDDWPAYFLPRVKSTARLSSTVIDGPQTDSPTNWNDYADVEWNYTLSTQGVGTYEIDTDHWVHSPYCAQFGITFEHSYWNAELTVEKPTIYYTDDPPFYFSGSATTSGTYSKEIALLSDPKGAVGSPSYVVTAGSQYGQVNGSTYKATQASPSCLSYDVKIRVNYGGLMSSELFIFNNSPASLEDWGGSELHPLSGPILGMEY